MRNDVRSAIFATVFAFLSMLLIAPTATAQNGANGDEYLNSLLNSANALTNRIRQFHSSEAAVLGDEEPDYCRTMRAGRAAIRRLRIAYENARAAGFNTTARTILRTARRLGDELAFEDFLDEEFGPKSICSPTASEPPWSYGAPTSTLTDGGIGSNILRFQFGGEFEFASSGLQTHASAEILNNVYSDSNSGDFNANGFSLDFKAYIPIAERFTLVPTIKHTWYREDPIKLGLDVDPLSIMPQETWLSYTQKSSTTVAVGVGTTVPTISSLMAGTAGQPGSGIFDVVLSYGRHYDDVTGWVLTDENGNVATTPFSKTLSGNYFALDVVYPLWIDAISGPLYESGIKPVVTAGVSVKTFDDIHVSHLSAFNNSYNVVVKPDNEWSFKIGAGFQFSGRYFFSQPIRQF